MCPLRHFWPNNFNNKRARMFKKTNILIIRVLMISIQELAITRQLGRYLFIFDCWKF